MDEVFVIMQIGDAQLDAVCDAAIDPAIRDAGFVPRRVDRHNQGDLLKSEIVQFIERSQIIVADVTNERPNCYLEIGYAMGLGKKSHLILTAREDHHHASPNFRRDGPKVHFDLEGYSILFWDPSNLPAFRTDLSRLIQRRQAIVRSTQRSVEAPETADWRETLRDQGEAGLAALDRSAYMEVAAEIRPAGDWSQPRLLEVLRQASIHTFGWPIAVILDDRDEYRPRPMSDGIFAEVSIRDSANPFNQDRRSYDLWKLYHDGRFYTLLSLFEDEREEESLFFEVRITRVTEALLLLARTYRRLEASDTDQITVWARHRGLAGRTLTAANAARDLWGRTSTEDEVESSFTTSLAELEANLTNYVKQIIDPLFVIFGFFELSDSVLEEIVDKFVADVR